jgi:pyruvate,water dikinase
MERWIADSVPSEKYPLHSRANAGEVMPDPVSPLSSSWALGGPGEWGWRDAYKRAGTFDMDEFDPDRNNNINVLGGYLYLNMSLTRIYGVRFPGLTPEMVDFQYFGTMPGITPYAEEARPTDESEVHTGRLAQYLAWTMSVEDLPELRADRDQVARLVASRPDLSELTLQEVIDYGRSFQPLLRRLFCMHIIVSAASGVGLAVVGQVCAAIGKPELALTLVAGVGDVDSAAPSWAMWELSRVVKRSEALTAAFDAGVEGLVDRIRALQEAGDAQAIEFWKQGGEFLERYESRGPNEWELRSQTWGTKPEIALAAVDRMRLAPDDDSPQARTDLRVAEREATTAAVRQALAGDAEVAGQFDAALRSALLFNPGRERTKTNCIKVVHEMRLAAREAGQRLVDAGLLDTVDQLFMFTDDELDDLVALAAGRPIVAIPEPRQTARDREAYYESLFDLEPPFVTHGAPPPVGEWPKRSTSGTLAEPGTTLTGIAGCPGVARGRARVVLDPTDPRGLEPGDVLVAPITDPSWTPLFVPAAAVVVDVGAQITHAVIVSRELGLPCVVSVTGATRTIPDGALVEVDGTVGTVTILEV